MYMSTPSCSIQLLSTSPIQVLSTQSEGWSGTQTSMTLPADQHKNSPTYLASAPQRSVLGFELIAFSEGPREKQTQGPVVNGCPLSPSGPLTLD
ncbi:Alsin [Manis pentadactyla]|nr:Alsin [Manis pentadactyla]